MQTGGCRATCLRQRMCLCSLPGPRTSSMIVSTARLWCLYAERTPIAVHPILSTRECRQFCPHTPVVDTIGQCQPNRGSRHGADANGCIFPHDIRKGLITAHLDMV